MKVLLAGKFHAESTPCDLEDAFITLHHQVIRFEFEQPSISSKPFLNKVYKVKNTLSALYKKTGFYENQRIKKLKTILSRYTIDFILVNRDFFTPKQIQFIKTQTKAPIAFWFTDHIGRLDKMMFLNAPYDFLFFKEPFIAKVFQKQFNKNAFYLPEACNPKNHKKIPLSEEDKQKYNCDLTVDGSLHPSRIRIFQQLKNYDVKIWGYPPPLWANISGLKPMIQNEFVSGQERCKAYLGSKIVINNFYPSEIIGVNGRLFEAGGIGAFQIASWRKGLTQFYEIDNEIVIFKTIPELKEKINFYLKNDTERQHISEKAYQRTHEEHTFAHRLQLMLDTVFSDAKGFEMPHFNL